MEGALDHLGMGSLQGKRIAVQGTGNVARYLIQKLLEKGVEKVYFVVESDLRVSIHSSLSKYVKFDSFFFFFYFAQVIASDISEASIATARALMQNDPRLETRLVPLGDNSILFEPSVHVVAPCALGGILNSDTIPKIKAKIVCGA
jgi:glutamate dehydrogenase/leucine dehydrogenase